MASDPIDLAKRARTGHQGAGARLIRMLEEGDPDALEGLRTLLPDAGRAHLIGITGPPGSCKSTLVDRLVHRSELLSVEGESFRLKEAKERADKRANSRPRRKPRKGPSS